MACTLNCTSTRERIQRNNWKKARKALESLFAFIVAQILNPKQKLQQKLLKLSSAFRDFYEFVHVSPRTMRRRQLSMPPEMFRCATQHRIAVCQLFHTRWLLQFGYQTVDLWAKVQKTGVALLLCSACSMGCSIIGLDDYTANQFWGSFLNYASQIVLQKLFVILRVRSFVRYYDTSQTIRHTPK